MLEIEQIGTEYGATEIRLVDRIPTENGEPVSVFSLKREGVNPLKVLSLNGEIAVLNLGNAVRLKRVITKREKGGYI